MADLIELECECGKVLKVPRSRAGQTGRCARCKRPVQIPPMPESGSPQDFAAPFTKQDQASQEKWEKLSKTTIRQSPFMGQSTSTNIEISSPSPRAEPQSPLYGSTAQPPRPSPFLAQEPSYEEDNFFAQEQVISESYEDASGVEGTEVYQSPPAGKPCPKCHNPSPADAEQCPYCGISFYEEMPAPEPLPPPEPAPPSKTPFASPRPPTGKIKKTKTKTRKLTWLWCSIFFVVGAAAGIFLGPGNLSVVPWAKIAKIFSPAPELPDLPPIAETGSTGPSTTPDAPPDKPVKPVKPDKEDIEATETLKQYDAALYQEIEGSTANIRVYLTALQDEHEKLKNNLALLDRKSPGIRLPDIDIAEKDADQYTRGLAQRLDRIQELKRKKEWAELRTFYTTEIKNRRLNALDPKGSRRIQNVRDASEKVKKLLASVSDQSKQPVTSDYLGKWYQGIGKQCEEMKKLGSKNLSFQTDTASKKFDRLQNVLLRCVERYPKEIDNDVEKLKKAQAGKNLDRWIEERRNNAINLKQKKHADLLAAFVKTKKFELDIMRDVGQLETAAKRLVADASDNRISEETVVRVVEILESIQRTYDEEKEEFSSAVANFYYWEPHK